MLKGTLVYTTSEGIKHKYYLSGSDSMLSLSLRISSNSYDALEYLESEQARNSAEFFVTPLESRRLDIGMTKCTVEYSPASTPEALDLISVNSDLKNKLKSANAEFFAKFASLVRYSKAHCYTINREGYTGLTVASDDFFAETHQRYKVPLGEGTNNFAFVELALGYIHRMEFDCEGYCLTLEDEYEQYPQILEKIKNKVEYALSYSADYLGFDGTPKFAPVDKYSSDLMYKDLNDIIANHPEKSYDWLLQNKYMIVTDDMLEDICMQIRNHDGYIYYDTETTGLDFTFKCEVGEGDKLVGLILSYKFGESYFFPVAMKSIKNLCGGNDVYFMEHYMKPILEGKELVVHRMEFDWRVSYVYGINANIVHDTMLLYKLTIGSEKPDMSVALKYLTSLLLKRDSLELHDLVKSNEWGEVDVNFSDLPEELVRLYACADTDNTMGLLEYALRNNLLQKYNATKVYQIELGFTYAIAYQEYYGQLVDLSRLDQLKAETEKGIEDTMAEIVKILGHSINLNSSPQLQKAMYQELGIPVQYNRKTGKPTTDKETLKRLSELTDVEGNVKYPFVKLLQDFRTHEAIRKVIDAFPTLITPDGYLFSEVDQFKATGRVSTKNPNYQGYNDVMKKYIVPRPGYYMTDQDYSSVESRILVSMVGNEETVTAFKDPDFDYHRSRASRMFSVPYEVVTSSLRRQSKGVNFGLFYGMADPSLGCHIFGEETPENTKRAAVLRSKYFVGLEDVEEAMNKWRNDSVQNGYTSTYFGRRRYYDKSKFSNSKIRRQGGNQVIQGTAADIYKKAIGNLFRRICKEGWLGKVLLSGFIHDELLSEVSDDIHPSDWLRVAREEFQVKIDGWCPIYMGFGYGCNWESAKHVELPIQLQDKIIEDFDSTGLVWNRNIEEFSAQIPDAIDRFTENMVTSYLSDSSNYDGYMKTSIFSAMLDILKEKLGKGNVPETLEEQVQEYAKLFNINVPESSFLEAKLDDSNISLNSDVVNIDFSDDDDDEELSIAEKQRVMDLRVESLGVYLDTEEKIVYLQLVPQPLLGMIQSQANRTKQGYQIYFIDLEKKMKYKTEAYLTSEAVNYIQSLYITYLNQKKLINA